MAKFDRFQNQISDELPYARGKILANTEDDYRKIAKAHALIRRRIASKESVFNFTGLERDYPARVDVRDLDDETSAALFEEELRERGLAHLGGSPSAHDVLLTNRLTAATFAVHLALVKSNETVVGISPSYTHPTVVRSARQVGARFVDTVGFQEFANVVEMEKNISLVVLTRLPVTYDILDISDVIKTIELAKSKGLRIYMDDAGGARVAPVIFGQPKGLELGADVVATGLDKYGTFGPRFGLLGGKKEMVSKIRGKAWEFGLEARPIFYSATLNSLRMYDPKRVVALVDTTKQIGVELKKLLGRYIHETPVTAQILGEDLLELILERKHLAIPPIVPFEATAALAMILLQDYGIITVHFAGVPPGTSSLLFKFASPETLANFGGAKRLAEVVSSSIEKLSELVTNPSEIQRLLFEQPIESMTKAEYAR